MNHLRSIFCSQRLPWLSFLLAIAAFAYAQSPTPPAATARSRGTVGSQGPLPVHAAFTPAQVASGGASFQQNCAFCHGKEAGGGESGPDLTRSKLVTADKNGEGIGDVIRSGRLAKGMPRFNLSDTEITDLVAFVHTQQDKAMSQTGTRKGVDESDLQTGDAEAGKRYFNGPGTCARCHSATGDLAGVATRYQGLKLEQQMLYPRGVPSKVTVTSAGKVFTGQLAYLDEFAVALVDSKGIYHSWSTGKVKYTVDAPVNAHVDLLSKYSDDDIHNLMAYMQTLK
ncbi:c-type cytochrome [Granulicella sp. WH15]|uniref:c-type cytochrome n=1 Tax=Granulicella sp. WH15 TaxID=2602070 RepID=UPI0013669921|nr:c-type cytochrome [Granulicella sp. WH15]QHN03517.1 c-type cytochrome [Granulicella sp. WH15]